MKLVIERSVTVITPTIGQSYLKQAVDSVQKQTYSNINHLIVIDGPKYAQAVHDLGIPVKDNIQTSISPENTGANGFYGHRIYAAYPHLVNTDYVVFLDEDNWLEPTHVQDLVNTIENNNLDWAHSLRNIYSQDGKFISQDCCESLGVWPVFWSLDKPQKEHLVDTSSYCFRREFLIQVCSLWHWGWGGDRRFYKILTSPPYNHKNFKTTGKHTLNYRLDGEMKKKYGSLDFFYQGNETVKRHFGGKYPWHS